MSVKCIVCGCTVPDDAASELDYARVVDGVLEGISTDPQHVMPALRREYSRGLN